MKSACLIARKALTAEDLAGVRALMEECYLYDGTDTRLNLSMMGDRDDKKVNDFCFLVGKRLVGYMPIASNPGGATR